MKLSILSQIMKLSILSQAGVIVMFTELTLALFAGCS